MNRVALNLRPSHLLSVAVLLAGCMNTPRNGDVVPNRASPIAFSALVKDAQGTIAFQAASVFDTTGAPVEWNTLASVDVASAGQFFATDSDGIRWWRADRTVKLSNLYWWPMSSGPGRYRALLRTMYSYNPDAPFALTTFESGSATAACIQDQVANNGSGGDIMYGCGRLNVPNYVAVYASGD